MKPNITHLGLPCLEQLSSINYIYIIIFASYTLWFSSLCYLEESHNAALTLDLGLSASAAGSCYIFTLAVRQPPVLASCIEIYYYYAVWKLLLYFYREFPLKILSVHIL